MSNLLGLLRRKSLWLAAIGAVLAIGIFVATTPTNEAIVIPGPGVTIYYSSGSYTTVVGARGTGCCGTVINWGITTKWKRFEQIYCLDVLCPN